MIAMSAQVSGASFVVNGVTYTVPAAGSYRFGLFNERDPRLGGEVGSDVNRDGNPAGSSGLFGVLWDTKTNTVWVDTNQNNSFADEMAMRDYKVAYHINYFGVDNPATAVAERMPFVIQTDGKNKFVNIGIVSGAHGSHVAGIAAGNSLFGGAVSGAAPGAKIVSVRVCLFIAGCTAHAMVEGMIHAAKQANVDVINMSIGGLPALNDGNNARAVLYDRLIERYNVQMFISAGNSGPGMNTIGDPSVAGKVMSVGAYITDDTYLAAYGAQLYEEDNLHYFSSRGPREDGGFKPNVVASGAAISTIPMWQPQGCLAQACPVGYALFNGTSMASPQAAGAAALLVSASKQTGAQRQPAQLRQAINSSARFLAGRYQAYEQGNGLMNVGRGVGFAEDQHQDERNPVVRRGQHDSERLPRHPWRRCGNQRPRGRERRRGLHPRVHLPPQRGPGRHEDLQPQLGRQRRYVQRGRRALPFLKAFRSRSTFPSFLPPLEPTRPFSTSTIPPRRASNTRR